ncbi:hypothetical protein [Rossellomorea marisflavi]|uniref:hypothetical protein n=1 Tax=Rossellomorea marisflavi TaxID=189381 RepID=UPI00345ABAB8
MKRIILSTLILGAFGGLVANGADASTPINFKENETVERSVQHPGDGKNWKWYYTDYSLNDDWYEKWYKYEDGAGTHYKIELYNSKGKLQKTRYK